MRIRTENNYTVTYPDSVVFLNDSNSIQIESSSGRVGAHITITNPSGDSTVLKYMSSLNTIIFNLSDTLKYLSDEDYLNNWSVSIDLFINGQAEDTFGFAFKCLNGRTFIDRSHGLASTIYIYNDDELDSVELYSPSAGALYIDDTPISLINAGMNIVDMSSLSVGSHQATILSEVSNPNVAITGVSDVTINDATIQFEYDTGDSTDTITGGDIWNTTIILPIIIDIEIVQHCDNSNFCELKYTDTDGMTRYLGGRVLEESISTKHTDYYKTDILPYNKPFNQFLYEKYKTIKVGFSEISNKAYAKDIFLSDTVYMRNYVGEWFTVGLKTETITSKNEDYTDFILEIYTCK